VNWAELRRKRAQELDFDDAAEPACKLGSSAKHRSHAAFQGPFPVAGNDDD
jgi:hypothetical protein